MRNKTREQLLIRVINLLDDAELGERQGTISDLLHSARRACRERNDFSSGQHALNALSQLRKARNSLRVAGASEHVLTPLEYALELLLPVCEDAQSDHRVLTLAYSPVWRVLLLLLLLLLPFGVMLTAEAVVWIARYLQHI